MNLNDLVAHLPKEVVFGPGARSRLRAHIRGKKVLVICSPRGKSQFLSDSVLRECIQSSESFEFLEVVHSNPSLESIQVIGDQSAALRADLLIGFGGGSAIDFAKSLSALDPTSKTQANLLELIQLQPEISQLVPVIAIPTTAGTGAEVTSFTTVWDHVLRKKLSLSHPNLKPSLALVDPELTRSVPSSVTLETGLDALNQALESVWNKNTTTKSYSFAWKSVALILPFLSSAVKNGEDLHLRTSLSLGATLAGMAIDITRTSLCHSISYPLTARFGVPHGVACSFPLMAVIKIVNQSHPNVLEGLASAIGFSDAESLVNEIKTVIQDNRVRQLVEAQVGDLSSLLTLIPEMHTPGRSDNFIEAVDDGLLAKILIESARP